jgi:cyanophycinase
MSKVLHRPKGKLFVIGGYEHKGLEKELSHHQKSNPNFAELQILKRFVNEMKGVDSRIEVVTSASKIPKEIGENYMYAFDKLGCKNVNVMDIRTPEDARKKRLVDRVKQADGIMFTGGDQLRLCNMLRDSPVLTVIKDRYESEEGFMIAGTSAGAMAMSRNMICKGGKAFLKGEISFGEGFGLIEEVVIDTHFVKRGRFGRLAQAVACTSTKIGIGIEEDTGLIISHGDEMEAVGSGLVIVMDGHEIADCNYNEIDEGAPIAVENLIVHILARGDKFTLNNREAEI